jgi:hypothetical protein
MAKDKQERLVELVRRGGKLVIGPVFPELDENFNPCRILRDFAGAAPAERLEAANPRLEVLGEPDVMINGELYGCGLPGGAEAAAFLCPSVSGFGAEAGTVLGWKKSFPGGGLILWLGMEWSYGYPSHRAMFRRVLGETGAHPLVECGNPNIWTSLFRDGNRGLLFVINHYSSPQEADIRIAGGSAKGGKVFFEQRGIALKPMEVKRIPFSF